MIKKDDSSGEAVANGVEFSLKTGGVETVGVKREVILSAGKPLSLSRLSSHYVFSTVYFNFFFRDMVVVGTLQSPQILELSGIGQREVLKKAGVECLVDLPGVGENLREY